jgi:hypothetical protein
MVWMISRSGEGNAVCPRFRPLLCRKSVRGRHPIPCSSTDGIYRCLNNLTDYAAK